MSDRAGGGAWSWLVGIVAGVAMMGLLVAAYEIGFNRGQGKAGAGGGQAASQPAGGGGGGGNKTTTGGGDKAALSGPGKQLFTESCGTCHTLSAAGTSGAAGPNLDQLKPDANKVLAATKNGGTGSGAMPKNIVSGKQAKEVADFVAAAAGG